MEGSGSVPSAQQGPNPYIQTILVWIHVWKSVQDFFQIKEEMHYFFPSSYLVRKAYILAGAELRNSCHILKKLS